MSRLTLKGFAFRAAAVMLPLAILLLAEIALRAAGVASAERQPFTRYDAAGSHLVLNTSYVARYFGGFRPGVAETPFLADKGPGTLRVFLLGGSSAAGFPYQSRHGIAGRLQERLSAALFPRRVEVVNLGLTAVNSFTMLDLGRAALGREADVLVVYGGHNEYYGAMGVATTESALGDRNSLKRLLIRLRQTALFTLIESALPSAKSPSDPNAARTLMARVIGDTDVMKGSDTFRAGIRQYAGNMSRLLDAAREADVPVLVGTLVSNLAGQRPLSADSLATAAFELGLRQLEAGAVEEARLAFLEARALDGTRFRAPDELNDWIRQEVPGLGGQVVDLESVVQSASATGIEGADLFTDHLHPNARGYHIMAGAFARQIEDLGLFVGDSRGLEVSPDSTLDALDAAHARLTLDRLLGDYPFVRDARPEESASQFEAALSQAEESGGIDSLAAHLITGRTIWLDAQRETAEYQLGRMDTLGALRSARSLAMMRPLRTQGMGQWLAVSAGGSASLHDEAIRLNLAASRSDTPLAFSALGAVLIKAGRLREAGLALDEAENREPNDEVILYNQARLHVLAGDTLGARGYFDRYRAARD